MTKRFVIHGFMVACGVSFCYFLGSFLNPSDAPTQSPSVAQQYACAEEDLVELLQGFEIEFEAGESIADRLDAIEHRGLATVFPVETFGSTGEFFGVLEFPSKIYAIVGGHRQLDDGISYFQLVKPGSSAADLVSRQILIRDGANSIWVMKTPPKVTAGSGTISISFDKPWINLGIDDGTEESRAAFLKDEATDQLMMPGQITLTNKGQDPVFVEEIASSCGCLAVNGKSRVPIPAGASHVVHLKANLGGKEKYSHSLIFVLGNDKNEKLSRKFDVFGNRVLGHKSISLTSVHLGELRSDRSKPFTFSMHESVDDRFEVLGTNVVGDKFFDVSVESRVVANGLYRHNFTIEPNAFGSIVEAFGQETRPLRAVLKIETTSPKQSSISLDVDARFVGKTAQPKVVALGQVQKNVVHRILIPESWVSGDLSLVELRQSEDSEAGINASVADDTEASQAIAVRFKECGVVEQPMTCLFKSDSGGSVSIDFVLSAFVMPEGD